MKMKGSKLYKDGEFHTEESIDERRMCEAIQLAEKGRGMVSPNPLVGAVIVRGDKVVGTGYHEHAGGPHAEVVAIHEAGTRAREATLYVTLEPCSSQGRTPPCTAAIIKAGITRVVAGMIDPNPKHYGRGFTALEEAGIEVKRGIMADEVAAQNEVFMKYIMTRVPFVTLKMAVSSDGCVAARPGARTRITGLEAEAYVHRLRAASDAVMIGSGTAVADNPRLTVRKLETSSAVRGRKASPARQPLRIVVDSYASLDPASHLATTAKKSPVLVVATTLASKKNTRRLRDLGVEVLELPSKSGLVPIKKMLKELGERETTSVLLEGGPTLARDFLDEGNIDKLILIVSPRTLGEGAVHFGTSPEELGFQTVKRKEIGKDELLEAYRCLPE